MDIDKVEAVIGANSFKAEGEKDVVQARYDQWLELVRLSLAVPIRGITRDRADGPQPEGRSEVVEPVMPPPAEGQLNRIMKHENKIVSLTVRAKTPTDAVLLLLYGQKEFNGSDAVSGWEINTGLDRSGQSIPRVDRVLDREAETGNVIVIGQRRSRRYRLTNVGATRAKELANALIATVA